MRSVDQRLHNDKLWCSHKNKTIKNTPFIFRLNMTLPGTDVKQCISRVGSHTLPTRGKSLERFNEVRHLFNSVA